MTTEDAVEACSHLVFNKHQTSFEDGIYYICMEIECFQFRLILVFKGLQGEEGGRRAVCVCADSIFFSISAKLSDPQTHYEVYNNILLDRILSNMYEHCHTPVSLRVL
jgi:hypothetical protein